ncbi:hypothetical protein AB0M46_48845 [Dactylosporangium sp. NPDC051485]|uniref:hypothetical protein n=1 Tax=Dactylosporangium sp. NPDC051485 TaxID=3154846 RepID=UPI003426FF1E
MARIGQLFGARAATDRDGDDLDDRTGHPVGGRAGDGVDDRAGAAPRTRTWRLGRRQDKGGDGIDDHRAAAAETSTWRLGTKHDTDDHAETSTLRLGAKHDTDDHAEAATVPAAGAMDRERDTATVRRSIDRGPVASPVTEQVTEPVPVRQGPARVSPLAVTGFFLGVVGVAAALTGILAPWAIAAGALGLLFSFGGIIAGVRPNVAGRGLGTLGVLLSGTAVVFAIIAMTGQVSWLDSHTDQVARLKDWLDARLPWMKDW